MTPSLELPRPDARARRRRRFLVLSLAGLAALAAALGISFTADTGTASPTVSAGSVGDLVIPLANGVQIPTDVDALPYSTVTLGSPNTVGTYDSPSWSVVAGSAGSVTDDGELFLVKADTTNAGGAARLVLNVYITNLAALQPNYSSYAWPIRIYWADGSTNAIDTAGDWQLVTSSSPAGAGFNAADFYLTSTSGVLTYTLPTDPDRYYLVTMDTGGSFYAIDAVDDATRDLAPTFYATVQPA